MLPSPLSQPRRPAKSKDKPKGNVCIDLITLIFKITFCRVLSYCDFLDFLTFRVDDCQKNLNCNFALTHYYAYNIVTLMHLRLALFAQLTCLFHYKDFVKIANLTGGDNGVCGIVVLDNFSSDVSVIIIRYDMCCANESFH